MFYDIDTKITYLFSLIIFAFHLRSEIFIEEPFYNDLANKIFIINYNVLMISGLFMLLTFFIKFDSHNIVYFIITFISIIITLV